MRVSRKLVKSSRTAHSTYRVRDLHVIDLFCDNLLQACIWLKPSKFSVSLSLLEGSKRFPTHAVVDLDKSHRMVGTCRCLVRHTEALEHELDDVEHVSSCGLICPREEIQNDGGNSQVKIEQCPGLDPVQAPAAVCVAFAILLGVRLCKTFGSELTEDHGVAEKPEDAILELHRKSVCKGALGRASLYRLLNGSAYVSRVRAPCDLPRLLLP
jgi:hypothetical protein